MSGEHTGTRLDGRVAVVTGAGRGLGRSHALALAGLGARVVVNDVADPGPVVDEIKARGGEAAGNDDGVDTWEGGAAVVASAVNTFGRVDIVVNNAGVLRDKSFAKMEPDMVRDVLAVHLEGAFHVTKAAWPAMLEQGHGRVIMTSSGSGLYGNFGQANYGAAKMGPVGLTRVLALEGARSNIRVNAIAPLARSHMTEGVLAADTLDKFPPEYVSAHLAAAHDRLVAVEPFSEPGSLADQVALAASS